MSLHPPDSAVMARAAGSDANASPVPALPVDPAPMCRTASQNGGRTKISRVDHNRSAEPRRGSALVVEPSALPEGDLGDVVGSSTDRGRRTSEGIKLGVTLDPEDNPAATANVPSPPPATKARPETESDEAPPVISRLDLKVLAFSALIHIALLLATGLLVVHTADVELPIHLTSTNTDTIVPETDRLELESLTTEAVGGLDTIAAGSFAPAVGAPAQVANPVVEQAARMPNPNVEIADIPLPRAEESNLMLNVQGSGAEHVGGAEGAVDRVAMEILRRLERGPVLVVWALDASGSLYEERQRLSKYIGQVYQDVLKLDNEELSAGDNLLTAAVAFGRDRKVLIETPSRDLSRIREAIENVPLDKTGIESTFTTVAEIARYFGRFKRNDTRYQTLCVILTDEVGDDEERLDLAIQAARDAAMPVYVLGSAALFGQVLGMVPYTDPESGQHYPALPVRQGPESIRNEMINLPFWNRGQDALHLDSGSGPYALSRLCGATGGIYFITRLGATKVQFDPARMREYKPDWVSIPEYEVMLAKNPLRMAVVQAAQITQQRLPGRPSLTFPPTGTDAFNTAMRENQFRADRTRITVDEALEPILKVAKLRDREPSKRWQAHYDLARGRLMAMKIRCFEYNSACARMKIDPLKFKNPNSNAWRLVPDNQVRFSDQAAKAAEQARELLKRVETEHAGTPWAYLARLELEEPLGFRWEETYVEPPQRNDNPPNRKNTPKKAEMARPPEPPKI